jgi:rsbT antagonist protein RsbS
MQVSRGIVVASIQVDLDDSVLAQFQQDLLERIHATGARAAILDVSGLEILDPDELAALRHLIGMTRLLGARSLLVGLRPGVVSALMQVGADIDGLEAAIDLDAAYALLEADLEPEPVEEDEADPTPSEAELPSEFDDAATEPAASSTWPSEGER